MKFAVVKENVVQNVIVADEAQKEELQQALCAELVDASPCRLAIGDLRVGGNWTRNVDGEQVILTERPTYDELAAQVAQYEAGAAETDAALEEMGVTVYE